MRPRPFDNQWNDKSAPCQTTRNWLQHTEWAPVQLTDHQHNFTMHLSPFVLLSPGSQLWEESFQRFKRSWCTFLFQKWTLIIHMTLFYHSYIFLLITDSLISVQVTWEHTCISENIHLYPWVYLWRTLCLKSSLFWLNSATIRNEQLTSRSLPQEHSTLSNSIPNSQHIALASASNFYVCWVSSIDSHFLFYIYSLISF